jgi:hypothetical protein
MRGTIYVYYYIRSTRPVLFNLIFDGTQQTTHAILFFSNIEDDGFNNQT